MSATPAQNAMWELMFDRLQTFRRERGHCRVPVRYAADRRFGNWVSLQRQCHHVL